MVKTFEKQYDKYIGEAEEFGLESLGLMSSQSWRKDPKHLLFYLSRYKFVSKMFEGFDRVLEVGCGDGFASRIVKQTTSHLTLTDIDPVFIEAVKERQKTQENLDYFVHNFLEGPVVSKKFEGIYLLDVLEHIDPSQDDLFLSNIIKNLSDAGVLLIGVPTLESEKYASEDSKIGHINLMSQKDLKKKMKTYFNNVFLFSMNDEVVHTGFYGMAHYMFALCVNIRNE